MSSYAELKDQIAALEKQAEVVRKEEISGAVAKILDLMNTYGIKVADLVKVGKNGGKKQSDNKSPVPAKYRDPEGRTWSGRGRMPSWMKDSDREAFEING